jgi:hypothetical protein
MTAETNTNTKAKAKTNAKTKAKAKTTAGPSTAHGTLTRAMLRSG